MFRRKTRQIERLEAKVGRCVDLMVEAARSLEATDRDLETLGLGLEDRNRQIANLQVTIKVLYAENAKLLDQVMPLQQRLYDALEEREQLLGENYDLAAQLDELEYPDVEFSGEFGL